MPREVDPINDPELFDKIDLAGSLSPGVVTLTGHDRKINWDIKDGQGQTGASLDLKNIPIVEFTATFYLADEEEIGQWPAFREVINSSVSGARPTALDIYHPDLANNKIKSVVLANFGGCVHDKKGGQTHAVKFQVYAPPKPKAGSPSGSKKKGPDPNAAANAELAALTEQYKNTPWGHL